MAKLLVVVEGGIIQNIVSDTEDVEVIIVDYDTDDAENTIELPTGSTICDTGTYPIEVDAEEVEKYFRYIKGENDVPDNGFIKVSEKNIDECVDKIKDFFHNKITFEHHPIYGINIVNATVIFDRCQETSKYLYGHISNKNDHIDIVYSKNACTSLDLDYCKINIGSCIKFDKTYMRNIMYIINEDKNGYIITVAQ